MNKAEVSKNEHVSQQLDRDMANIKEDTGLNTTHLDEATVNIDSKNQNCCLQ